MEVLQGFVQHVLLPEVLQPFLESKEVSLHLVFSYMPYFGSELQKFERAKEIHERLAAFLAGKRTFFDHVNPEEELKDQEDLEEP